MNFKHVFSVAVSAFGGGFVAWAEAHVTAGVPTTAQGIQAFVAGGILAGLIAVFHLYQPVPGSEVPQ